MRLVLLADLPELTEEQEEFCERVAGSKNEYLKKCAESVMLLREHGLDAYSFSEFYGDRQIDYMGVQKNVKKKILTKVGIDKKFSSKFNSFMFSRADLAQKFRGRNLTHCELKDAAAHGMSLYVTHGTLLKKIFLGKNLVVINHDTMNLKHFSLCDLVPGFEDLANTPTFPIGILESKFY